MNYQKILTYLLIIIISSLLVACGKNLPDNYGIYAYTDKGRTALPSQRIFFSGNLFQSISGLKGASSNGYDSVDHFIVFQKDINPNLIHIAKLEFKKGGSIQNIFGSTHIDVNLWIPSKNINFDVAPIDGKKDMYKLTPKEKMTTGFYALHFGGLGNTSTIEASVGNIAYDFVVGNSDDYQSYEILKKRNEEKVTGEAKNLLATMNNGFNNRDYAKIKDIYKPNGRNPTDSEWQEFTKGLGTWLDDAGTISDSKILSSIISENDGTFQIQTTYQKKGQQQEKLVVRNIEGKFIIISIE